MSEPTTPTDPRPTLNDKELLYSATERCRCGAGLAYPLDHKLAMMLRAWVCSKVLKGEGQATNQFKAVMQGRREGDGDHDRLDFAFFKVREETSINNRGGHTTRPLGTIALTAPHFECKKCDHKWKGEPYSACGLGHHAFAGSCPNCGNTYGANGTWKSGEEPRVEGRYLDVVVDAITQSEAV